MSYRRDRAPALRWSRWVRERESIIKATGLPGDTVASQRAFEYLIGHGYSAAGYAKEVPWFDVETLTTEQRLWLRRLVEEYVREFYPPREPGGPPTWLPLRWLWEDDGCST